MIHERMAVAVHDSTRREATVHAEPLAPATNTTIRPVNGDECQGCLLPGGRFIPDRIAPRIAASQGHAGTNDLAPSRDGGGPRVESSADPPRPEGPKHDSPGQRPGEIRHKPNPALKGRHNRARETRAEPRMS